MEMKKHLIQGAVGAAMLGGVYMLKTDVSFDDLVSPSKKTKVAKSKSSLSEIDMLKNKRRRKLRKRSGIRKLDRSLSGGVSVGSSSRAPASTGQSAQDAFANAYENTSASASNSIPVDSSSYADSGSVAASDYSTPATSDYSDSYSDSSGSEIDGATTGGGGAGGTGNCVNCVAAPPPEDNDDLPPTPENTIPSILDVSTTSLNGNYSPIDGSVSISVRFFEPVTVSGGTPTLELETGVEDTLVPYSGGSGTATLIFSYSILNGDFATDLTYKSNKSLALNGATIVASDDSTPADLNLPLLTDPNSLVKKHDINIVDDVIPEITRIDSSSDPLITYGEDSKINITVNFTEIIDVAGGAPFLNLDSGGTAPFVDGSGTRELNFEYTVSAGDTSSDLDVANFALAGATIADPSGNNADLLSFPFGLTLADLNDLEIDTTPPTILNINSPDPNIIPYKEGKLITIEVNFSEDVFISGIGTPTLDLNNTKSAAYVSGDGTSQLVFSYTVDPGDEVPIGGPWLLDVTAFNLGTSFLKDDINNNAVLALPAGQNLVNNKPLIIDTIDPFITNMNVNPFPSVDDYLAIGESVTILVDFSENVFTSGAQTLALSSGGVATVTGGSGSSQLSFIYTVVAGESTLDLDAIAMTVGTYVRDISENDANLAVPPNGGGNDRVAEYNNIVVDTVVPVITSIVKTPLTNMNKGIDFNFASTYVVTFSENIFITPTPQLNLDSGATLNMASNTVNTITFNYTVTEGENSLDLNAVSMLAGGGIIDIAGNNSDLTMPVGTNIADGVDVVVDGTRPVITNITSPTGDGFYTVGNDIDIDVHFSEPVDIVGPVRLQVNSSGASFAAYEAGTGSNKITFRYTVAGGEGSADLTVTLFDLNTGTVRDAFLNNSYTTLPAVGGAVDRLEENHDVAVDTGAPFISDIDSSFGDGTYIVGDTIDVRVNFNENIVISGGPPTLTLDSGGTATYVGVVGNSATFNYLILPGELSTDLNVTSFNLNGALIRDAATNIGVTALPANNLIVTKNLNIEGGIPTIVDIDTSTPDGYYNEYDPNIIINVHFSEPVYVTGALPKLDLNVGGGRYAEYNGVGEGTSTLQLSYTINVGDNTADLDYLGTSLNLSGGAIKDSAGNVLINSIPVPGTVGWLGNQHAVIVDTLPPVDPPANPSFLDAVDGDGNEVALNWTDFIDANGIVEHQIFLFTDSNCLTPTPAGVDAGKTLSSVANDNGILDGLANATYWTKVKAFDIVGNTTTTACSTDSIIVDYSPPVVLEVRSTIQPNPDVTTYHLGETIDIETVWSEPVVISGPTVCLDLNINGGQLACYQTGSGTNKIIFRHVVQAGDNSTELSYSGISALSLAGGYIRDLFDTPANLTLAIPGIAGSLSFNDNIIVDTQGPTIDSIFVTQLDGVTAKPDATYNVGEQMSVMIDFNEPVAIGVTPPSITLNSFREVPCVVWPTDTSMLKCDYTVVQGDNTTDLDAELITSLSPGTFIEDPHLNSAVLTLPAIGGANSISDDQAIVISTIPNFDNTVEDVFYSYKYAGDMYVAGDFTKYGNDSSPGLARINANLTFDAAFNVGVGFTGTVKTVAEALDGSGDIYVGGDFTQYQGVSHNKIVRLNDDGTVDAGFATATGFDLVVHRIRAVNDGSGDIFVAGKFTEYQGNVITSNKIVRLNSDGSIDASFNAGNTFGASTAENIHDFIFEEDVYGKINVAGTQPGAELVRINANGSVDQLFSSNAGTRGLTFDPLIPSEFIAVGSSTDSGRDYFARFENTGAQSATVPAGPTTFDARVNTIDKSLYGDSKYYVGGIFTDNDGTSVNRVVRVNEDGSNDAGFNAVIGTGAASLDILGIKHDPYGTGRVIAYGTHTEFNTNEGRRHFTILDSLGSSTTPYITNMDSPGGNATYTVDDTVAIHLTFSENITLAGGSAKLRMDVGVRYDTADCASVTASNTLVCNYIVKVGDTNVDFDVSSESSLFLPAGVTITQTAAPNNPATLRTPVPSPLVSPSLSFNRTIVIDGALVFDGEVHAVAFVDDGTGALYVGGDFTQYHGVSKPGIVKLNSDLSIDASFNPAVGFDGPVYDIAVMADGSGIVVVGNFQNYQGATARKVIKLDHAGTRNAAFEANRPDCDTNVLRPLRSVAEALDGSGNVYIGGVLQSCGGNLSSIWKIDPAGNDIGFADMLTQGFLNLGGGASPDIKDIKIDPQGTGDLLISVAGGAGYPGSTIRYQEVGGNFDFTWVTRVTKNGEYVGVLNSSESPNAAPNTIGFSLRDDGEVYLGGDFSSFDSIANPTNAAKLFGVVDISGNNSTTFVSTGTPTFDGVSSEVKAIAAATDGSGDLYIGGRFSSFKGSAQEGLIRVNRDGTQDVIGEIGTGLDNINTDWVNALDVAEDSSGLVAVGGSFTQLNGRIVSNIAIVDPRIDKNNPAPIVNRVHSPDSGTIAAGPVDIYIEFSEGITVNTGGGVPYILINLDGMAVKAFYTGMFNATTAIFQFTINPGDNTPDLNYINKYSFITNGGTVTSTGTGNHAVATLPRVNGPSSLGGQESIVIDTTAVVTNVTSPTANGEFFIGATIDVDVTFDQNAFVNSGTPTLIMGTGRVKGTANYISGHGTTTLRFRYIVAADEHSDDLDYDATNALAGDIVNSVGSPASLTLPALGGVGSLANNKNLDVYVRSFIKQVGATMVTEEAAIVQVIGDETTKQMNGTFNNNNGDFFVAGTTTADFGEAHGGGLNDAFVTKFNRSGKVQWNTQLGSITVDVGLSGDSSGSERFRGACVTPYQDKIIIPLRTSAPFLEANGGAEDQVVVQINDNGSVDWARHYGSTTATAETLTINNAEKPRGCTFDPSGNVYVVGDTASNFVQTKGSTGTDTYLTKLSNTGTPLAEYQYGTSEGTSANADDGGLVIHHANNKLYVGGMVDPGPDFIEALGAANDDIFTHRFSPASLTLDWSKHYGASSLGTNIDANDSIQAILADNFNNVYMAGYTEGTFGEANAGGTDAIVTKIDETSGAVLWTRHFGLITQGGSASGNESINALAMDSVANTLYAFGTTDGNFAETNAGGTDFIIISLDMTTGATNWIKQIGTTTATTLGLNAAGSELASAIYVESGTQAIYMYGQSDGAFAETNGGNNDIVIMKMKSDGTFNP